MEIHVIATCWLDAALHKCPPYLPQLVYFSVSWYSIHCTLLSGTLNHQPAHEAIMAAESQGTCKDDYQRVPQEELLGSSQVLRKASAPSGKPLQCV